MLLNLIPEYREGRKQLNKRYLNMNRDDPERKIIGGMIRDMEFALEWLQTGRMPGQIKGIDRKRVYQVNEWNRKKLAYGVNGYWDEDMGAFISKPNYKDPFQEVEDKIDRELEMKKHA